MTTMTSADRFVTGGVDTHRDFHVAAALDQLGGVLGTAQFPTTAKGYRSLLSWLAGFGTIEAVGVEGTGSYGAALARYLTESDVRVIEVGRPNRQVRRRHGKTDVVDAIAAGRAVLNADATATPKSHDGPVEALRALKMVQRSARKARTQALNQLHALVLTAPEELRGKLRGRKNRDLITTCASFRVRAEDDSLNSILRLSMRELAHRNPAPRGAEPNRARPDAAHHHRDRTRAGGQARRRPGHRGHPAHHRRGQPWPARP
jgi:transposase